MLLRRLETLMLVSSLFVAGCSESKDSSKTPAPGDADPNVDAGDGDGDPNVDAGDVDPNVDAGDGDADVDAGVCFGLADGTPCGDANDGACDAPDTCQGGVCEPNYATSGTLCGDMEATWCTPSDRCDGEGSCESAGPTQGMACYDCAQGGGLCGACSEGTCGDAPSCVVSPPFAVATPVVDNNGQDGNMFDIVATNTVVVTGFEGNIANTPNPTTEYYIYYKAGSHVGFETAPEAWTHLAGPLAITPNTPSTLTPIIDGLSVVIPAGQTYAFYLTNTADVSNNNRYHTGTATGDVSAEDENIQINQGTGGAYPFGIFFNARPWEGRVHYETALGANPTGTLPVDGAMFDVEATNAIAVSALDVHLADGTHALEVYFKRGTHVGAETQGSVWALLGSQANLVSAGANTFTTVPFSAEVYLATGEIGAFYVSTGAASGAVLTRAGSEVGNVVETSADAKLHEGRAISGTFGAVGAASVGEARFHYGACVP